MADREPALQVCCELHVTRVDAVSPTVCPTCDRHLRVIDRRWVELGRQSPLPDSGNDVDEPETFCGSHVCDGRCRACAAHWKAERDALRAQIDAMSEEPGSGRSLWEQNAILRAEIDVWKARATHCTCGWRWSKKADCPVPEHRAHGIKYGT